MKLEVSHNEIVAGLTASLAASGINAFDPATCHVEFKLDKKSGQLSAVLNTEHPAPAEEKPKAEAKAKPEVLKEEPKADPKPETPAEPEAPATPETPAAEGAEGDTADNLFD